MNELLFDEVRDIIGESQPRVRVVNKEESQFHVFLSKLLFFVNYMEFATTIGWTIALSPADKGNWQLLAHEGVHILQAKRQTRLLHSFLYMLPQILAPIGLVAAVVLLSWVPLALMVCLLPIPAYYRTQKELEAYELTLMIAQWECGDSYKAVSVMENIIKNFTGPNYYFMWPLAGYIRMRLWEAIVKAAHWNDLDRRVTDEYANDIYTVMFHYGVLHEENS